MSSADFTRDDATACVRSLAARHGFHDPDYRGELAQIFDGRGRSLRYLRPRGVTLDAFGEILWDGAITTRRLDPNEVWHVLSQAFGPDGTPRTAAKPPSRRAVTEAEAKARRCRNRKFVCPTPDCGQIIRGTRNTMVDCGLCHELTGATVRMVRVDPLPEEIGREQV